MPRSPIPTRDQAITTLTEALRRTRAIAAHLEWALHALRPDSGEHMADVEHHLCAVHTDIHKVKQAAQRSLRYALRDGQHPTENAHG